MNTPIPYYRKGTKATEECFILKAHLKACIVDKNWVQGRKGI